MTSGASDAPAEASGLGRILTGLVLAAALGLGVSWRLDGLTSMPLYGDEYHGARIAKREFWNIFTTYDLYGTHVPLPLVQRVFALTFEPGILTFRLPAVIAGILTLILFYPAARALIGRGPALVGTLALATSPVHVYYSRFGRAYAMTMFLCLVLVWLVHRADRQRWRGPPLLVGVGLTAALLPWTHLASVGLVVGVGLAAMGLAWSREGTARGALRPLLVFALAAAVCALLFLPTFEQVIDYAGKIPDKRKDRPETLLGIPTLLAGGGIAGVVWMAGVPLAVVGLLRRGRASALLLGSSILGPLLFLFVMRPHGMEYAYARYLVNALPAMILLLAWLFVRPLSGVVGNALGTAFGLGLVLLTHLTGPLKPTRAPQGPFANSYLAMRALPAFDRPFRFTPEIYRTIAEDPDVTRIIEAPILHSRAVLLFRNYYLQHRKEVLVGLAATPEDVRLNGPYAFVGSPRLGPQTGAQYLILHKDLLRELANYWLFVYDRVWPKFENPWDRGLMSRHRTYFVPEDKPKEMATTLIEPLRNQLGPPVYEDEIVVAWKLRKGRAGQEESR
jgi:hypothetical protein